MGRHHRALASAILWLVLTAAAASGAAGQTQASCQASCEELQPLTLLQWSEERSEAEVYTFPWGARYAYQPLDYVALSKEVCACIQQPQGWKNPSPALGTATCKLLRLLLPPINADE